MVEDARCNTMEHFHPRSESCFPMQIIIILMPFPFFNSVNTWYHLIKFYNCLSQNCLLSKPFELNREWTDLILMFHFFSLFTKHHIVFIHNLENSPPSSCITRRTRESQSNNGNWTVFPTFQTTVFIYFLFCSNQYVVFSGGCAGQRSS